MQAGIGAYRVAEVEEDTDWADSGVYFKHRGIGNYFVADILPGSSAAQASLIRRLGWEAATRSVTSCARDQR